MNEIKSHDVERTDVSLKTEPTFDPDKRIRPREDDITTLFEPTYDPDKRIDCRIVFIENDNKFDPDKRIKTSVNVMSISEQIEKKEVKGGAYSEVKKNSNGETHEVHHMPADTTSELSHGDGPAIRMEKADHRQTASCGYSKEAQEYRATQKKLIEEGKFREALQMDIDDIHEKFGDKYDDAIAEMLVYVDQLESEGRI